MNIAVPHGCDGCDREVECCDVQIVPLEVLIIVLVQPAGAVGLLLVQCNDDPAAGSDMAEKEEDEERKEELVGAKAGLEDVVDVAGELVSGAH